MPTEYESERTVTREQAAATLREMADDIATGSLLVGEDDESIAVEIPDDVALEIELETEDGERSLELELEWPEQRSPEGDSPEQNLTETASSEATSVERDTSESLARFELFRDQGGEWRWRLVHRNGNVIATSGEGYSRKHNAEKGLRSVVRNAPNADVVDDASG